MKNLQFEIARSFQRKVNLGNYESFDTFCSAKESFYEMPTEKQKEVTSEALYNLCRNEVMKSIENYKIEYIKGEDKPQKKEFMPESQAMEEKGQEEMFNQKIAEENEELETLNIEDL